MTRCQITAPSKALGLHPAAAYIKQLVILVIARKQDSRTLFYRRYSARVMRLTRGVTRRVPLWQSWHSAVVTT